MRSTYAGIAQLVEHNLAKVGVGSSSLLSRSIFSSVEALLRARNLESVSRSSPTSFILIYEVVASNNDVVDLCSKNALIPVQPLNHLVWLHMTR